mgnify:CR=1 FL=1
MQILMAVSFLNWKSWYGNHLEITPTIVSKLFLDRFDLIGKSFIYGMKDNSLSWVDFARISQSLEIKA